MCIRDSTSTVTTVPSDILCGSTAGLKALVYGIISGKTIPTFSNLKFEITKTSLSKLAN